MSRPALLAALAVAAPAFGQCAFNRCATPAVVTEAVVATPIVAAVPLYGAGYDDSANQNRELLKRLSEQNERLTRLVEKLAGPASAEVPASKPVASDRAALDAFGIFNRSCTACHSGASPKGGFSFAGTDGRFKSLSEGEIAGILKRIDAGTMPPPGRKEYPALTASEKVVVRAALTAPDPAPAPQPQATLPAPPPQPQPAPPPPAPTMTPLFAKGDSVRLKGNAKTSYRVLAFCEDKALVEDLADPGHVGLLPMLALEKP